MEVEIIIAFHSVLHSILLPFFVKVFYRSALYAKCESGLSVYCGIAKYLS